MTDTRARLLKILSSRPGPHSGAGLARALGLSRAAIHKHVQRLRLAGGRIRGTQNRGYALTISSDVLDPAAIVSPWRAPVVLWKTVPSTQDDAKGRAARGAPEGTLVLARRQTAGRGRRGREWVSPEGGLWYSLVLRPPLPPDRTPALTLVAALSWARVLRARGCPAELKWPNDLWLGGKKIAGLLTEMSAEADRVSWMVIGVGMNVNNAVPERLIRTAAALRAPGGDPLPRAALLSEWLKIFFAAYQRFLKEGFKPFLAEYQRCLLWRGERVCFEEGETQRPGRLRGVDENGCLRVETRRGLRVLSGGDVCQLRPS